MGDDNQFAIFWLKQIKEKYIHGGDEEFDSCRKRAIDIAIKELEKPNEIVRCKDCQHQDDLQYEVDGKFVCRKGHGWNTNDFFCADGEPRKRKGGDGE